MKTCPKCSLAKDESAFSKYRAKKSGLQTYCKACVKAYDKIRYTDPKRRRQLKISSDLVDERNRNYVYEHLLTHPCIDCGERDILVLDFDHLSDKEDNISNLIYREVSVATLQNEIDKCVVRCANCHRKKTAKEKGYWKYKFLQNRE